jgi:hypothetical protein
MLKYMRKFLKTLKRDFIPHKGNEFRPHFLRHESMMVFLFLIVAIEIGFLIQVFVIFDKTNFLASVLPGVLTNLTNAQRAENNAPPLTESALLAQAAEMKAKDMAERGYFAHTSPDGKTPWYWLQQVGYKYTYAGENLAVNFFESDDVARAWMNSPTHRANIVKENYTEIGIGVAKGVYEGRNTVFVAQFFGTPVAVAAAPAPVVTPTPIPKPSPKPAPISTPQPKPIPTPTPEPEPVVTPPTEVVLVPEAAPSTTRILGEEVIEVATAAKDEVLSSPRQYMSYAYGGILLIIVTALSIVVFMKPQITHPALVARGAVLAIVILAILFIDTRVLTIDNTKVPTDGLSASVIAY